MKGYYKSAEFVEECAEGDTMVIYLQHAAHPLEAVLLRGVGSLLGHHHDPLVPQHRHGEHGYPAGRRKQTHVHVSVTAYYTCC